MKGPRLQLALLGLLLAWALASQPTYSALELILGSESGRIFKFPLSFSATASP